MIVKRQKVGFNLCFTDVSDPRLHQHVQMIKFFLRFRDPLAHPLLAVVAEADEIPHQKGILTKVRSKISASMIVSATRFASPTCVLVVCETKCPPGEV